jgi:hypothetical protein
MFERKTAVFLFHLIQDVNVLRPLMVMASRDFGFDVSLLISSKFHVRDMAGTWATELEQLAVELGATVTTFQNDLEAFQSLDGRGIIFSASESSLREHGTTHAIFRFAPPTYLKVTLQHGFECVGFRHSAAHDRAYGTSISFGADIICSWQPPEWQHSLAASQRDKLVVTGPTAALQTWSGPVEPLPRPTGVVCENLHSVRLSEGQLASEFVSTFNDYCARLGGVGQEVVLRPHPGGQYSLKNGLPLPPNAAINNAPMYRLDLRRFSHGISAPSSVLIDMLLAGIPTAVWRDAAGDIDTSNYEGLTEVSSAREWAQFAQDAVNSPDHFVEVQERFLSRQQLLIDPKQVFARFTAILDAAGRIGSQTGRLADQRLLVVANAHLPTVQVCLEHPMKALTSSGRVQIELLTEAELIDAAQGPIAGSASLADWIGRSIDQLAPDALIFSRYSGPHGELLVDAARSRGIPIIYQIDDDLLHVPRSLGESKFAYHNASERLAAVRSLIGAADLVYCSTEALAQRPSAYPKTCRASQR